MQKIRPLNILCLVSLSMMMSVEAVRAQDGEGQNSNYPWPIPSNPTNNENTPTQPTNNSEGVYFTSTPIKNISVNESYAYALTAGGSGNNYTFSATQTLPSWLKLNPGPGGTVKLNGTSISQPINPSEDADGNIYVASGAGTKIYKITPAGVVSEWMTVNNWASNATIIIGNYFYKADVNSNTKGIVRYDMTQQNPTAEIVHPNSGFNSLNYHDGFLYASNANGGKVVKISLTNFAATDFITNVEYVGGLQFLSNGDILVASGTAKKIIKISGSNQTTVIDDLPYTPLDVKMAADGSIYVSMMGGLRKYNADYSYSNQLVGSGYIYNMLISAEGKIIYSNPSGGGAEGVYTVSPAAGLVGKPGADDLGGHIIKLKVTDGYTSADQEFTITVADLQAPMIVSNTPANYATDVPVNTKIKLEFNEKVLAREGSIAIHKGSFLPEALIDVTSSAVSIDDKLVTITLPQNLAANTTYYVTVPSGTFKDVAGNYYGQNSNTNTNTNTNSSNTNNNYNNNYYSNENSNNTTTTTTTSTTTTSNSSNEFSFSFTTVKKLQSITLAAKDTVIYGVGAYDPGAMASSEMPVYYTSSDESVAFVNQSGTILIKSAGEVEITAHQDGGNGYVAAESVKQKLTVLKKEVTAVIITDMDIVKTYDGNTSIDLNEGGIYLENALSSDYVWVSAKTEFDNKNAGTGKTVTATEFVLHGKDADNYKLENTQATAMGTIKQRNIKAFLWEGVHPTKPYDGKTTIEMPASKFELDGVLEGENISVTATGNYDDKNAGDDKMIIVNNFKLAGEGKENYKISTESRETWGSITAVPLTITADNKTKKQGTENPALTFTYTGFVGSDNATNLGEMPKASTTASAKSAIGYYEITAEGGESNNYNITHVNGKLSVIPAENTHIKVWSDNSNLHVRIYSEVAQKSAIILYTEVGQPIIIQQKQLSVGINTVSLPIIPLTRGFYVLNVNADKFREAERVKIK